VVGSGVLGGAWLVMGGREGRSKCGLGWVVVGRRGLVACWSRGFWDFVPTVGKWV
jgi:hypothetical protein